MSFLYLTSCFVCFLFTSTAFANIFFIKDNSLLENSKESLVTLSPEKFSQIMLANTKWPRHLRVDSKKYKVKYTFDRRLESFIKKQLRMYHPDHSSVVVIENKSGNILAAIDYNREEKMFARNLAFSNTHPAASIFKIITAADLLENSSVNIDTKFSYIGKSTTLYKYQLKEPIPNYRYKKVLNLKKAFATSNNVIFARSAIENLNPEGLKKMAEKFGFNRNLLNGIELPSSVFVKPSDDYNFAEFSSGFNKKTMMSPVHGAVIASVIANGGILRFPKVIKEMENLKTKKLIYPPVKKDEVVLTPKTSDDLRLLFQETVKKGTARSSFRRSRKLLNTLEIGGKTGTLTGGIPYGRRDWFVSYAKPKSESSDQGISICVMIVNKKKWYVKSSLVAKNIMDFYYLKSQRENIVSDKN